MPKLRRFALPMLATILLLLAWHAAVETLDIPDYILPPPAQVLEALASAELWQVHAIQTAMEAVIGFATGALVATAIAVVFVHSQTLRLSFYPYVIALKTVPIVAVAPLLVLWFGSGLSSKAAVAALISFFPILVNAVRGLTTIDPEALELFRSLGASRLEVLAKLRLPASLPYVFAALKVSSTLSVVGALVGEFTGANSGLGFLILYASRWLDTPTVFAGIVASSLVGMTFFGVLSLLERRVIYWTEPL